MRIYAKRTAGKPLVQQVYLDTSRTGKKPSIFATPAEVILDAGIELYNWWLSTKEPDENTVFSFKADKPDPPLWTSKLERDEVEKACPRFPLVQQITNQVAAALATTPFANQGARGTAIHMGVKRVSDGFNDPTLTTGESIYKRDIDASRYGLKGTVRIDILERRDDDVICVYDLKTSRAYLDRPRLFSLYENVFEKYGSAKIIVIEVRPVR